MIWLFIFATLKRTLILKYWLSRLIQVFILFYLLDLVFPLPREKSWSKVVTARDGNLLAAYLTEDDKWRMKTSLDEVSEDLLTAIVAKEDKWFWYHPGVNPVAIGRAAWSNLVTGRRTSGASTITMQLARMMEPKSRTYWSKVREMFRAFQLEWHFSKTEILERYLSYLPYGGNVEGVKAASYIYFDRPPASLSLAQNTLMTIIPNRPTSLRPGAENPELRQARDKWLRRFKDEGIFPISDLNAAIDEPINALRHQITPLAPHISRRLSWSLGQTEIRSTIDMEIQATTERILENYIRRSRHKGISNGAILVIDNHTSEVLAYCGSADFNDMEHSGQVDGVTALRSPGSTLKPAAYAMAMDKGILTPDTRMLDVPTSWNGYSPDNYDEKFRGPVSMAYALRHSLNITAVDALQRAGFNDFIELLIASGMSGIEDQRDNLGLSVVLGGCGVTLEELTRLFTAFARGGKVYPLKYVIEEKLIKEEPSGTRVFSEESAWLIADILSGIERPDLPNALVSASGRAKVSWKTGTSYGRRDAWSVGFTPSFTIGVWIGNFDGRGAPDLSGTTLAVPLLFDLFGALDNEGMTESFERPPGVHKRKICLETGDLPSEFCRHTGKGYYIRDRSPRKMCDQEKMLYVNSDSTMQYCTGCLPNEGYVKSSFPVYPPELCLWYENTGQEYKKPPPHNPGCTATFDGTGPKILSPSPDFEYFVEDGAGQELLLQAASDTRVNIHYWYINDEFFRSCRPGEKVFYPAKPGTLKITCMDDKGRRNTVDIIVKTY